MESKSRDWLTTLGTVLIILGVAVWGVYAVQRWGLDQDVTAHQFLPYHLAGVIPGVILKRRGLFLSIIKRIQGNPRA